MWLSKMSAHALSEPTSAADMGVVTIGGAQPGVQTDGERRNLPVCGPGGYRWTPRKGAEVLVIKTGEGEHLVVGETGDSQPEEICLRASGAEIRLKNGTVSVTGNLQVSGNLLVSGSADVRGALYVAGLPYKPCTCAL